MSKRAFLGFDKDAERVMAAAQGIAKQLNHQQLRPTHILKALCIRKGTTASKVLSGINGRLPRLIPLGLGRYLEPGSTPPPQSRNLPSTPGTNAVLDAAIEEAKATHSPSVGTEHLLIAIHQARGTNASKCLRDFGVQLSRVRAGERPYALSSELRAQRKAPALFSAGAQSFMSYRLLPLQRGALRSRRGLSNLVRNRHV